MLSWRSSSLPTVPQGAASNYKDLLSEQGVRRFREALGRSRGGLTTKIHLAADQRCRPIAFLTSEGQRHDSIAFEMVLAEVRIDRVGPGRPRTRPDWVLADKAYSHPSTRNDLRRRRIAHTIPERQDQKDRRKAKGSKGGRPPGFDTAAYAQRNTVERGFL